MSRIPLVFPNRNRAVVSLCLAIAAIVAIATLGLNHRAEIPQASQGLVPAVFAAQQSSETLWPLSIDYPEDGSIFPPGITPPAILWRDAAGSSWTIDVFFADKTPPIHFVTGAERIKIPPIDAQAVSDTNKPPTLTAQQAAMFTWAPDASTWAAIQAHSVKAPATLVISGMRDGRTVLSQARVAFTTSSDPVGAPIFYRDVPLMPTLGVNGVVSPLAPDAIHLIHWCLRDIRKPASRVLLKDLSLIHISETPTKTCRDCSSRSLRKRILPISRKSVSYTHLDVYKRQP